MRRSSRKLFAVLGAGLLTCSLVPAAAQAEIPVNTWVNMEPVTAMGPEASEDDEEPDYRAYSTLVGGKDGLIYYWGGGHNAYGGNDIDVYDPAANEWRQLTEEENWKTDCDSPGWESWTCAGLQDSFGSSWQPAELTPRGRPFINHTYDRSGWVADRGQYCTITLNEGEWCYDAAKGDQDGAWTQVTGNLLHERTGGERLRQMSVGYEPSLGTRVLFINGGYRVVWKYDEGTGTWSEISGISLLAEKWGETFAEYSPDHGAHLLITGENKSASNQVWQLVDIPDRRVTRITQLRDAFPDFEGTDTFEYSPELKKFIVMANNIATGSGFGVFTYDPETDIWDRIYLDGTKPADPDLNWDLFERDPVTGTYVFLRLDEQREIVDLRTFAFRIDAQVVDNQPDPCPADTCVGDGFSFGSIQSAIASTPAGGTVGIADGTYYQCVTTEKPVTLKALSGRPHLTGSICEGKGVVVSKAPGTVTLKGLEVSGATSVKGIWLDNGAGNLVLRDMKVHNSGMGVFAGPGAGRLEIYDSEIFDIHDNDEKAHFIYAGENDVLIAEGNYLHGGTDGHFIKAKSVDSALRYNHIDQELFTDINLIDVWACGSNRIIGNVIRTVDTSDAVNAIGLTRRTSQDKPCPVAPRSEATVLYNSFQKNGEARWSTFLDNKENAALELKNNAVANARLLRRADDSWIGDDADNADPSSFADAYLHPVSPEAAVCASALPGKEYAHMVGTGSRANGGDMGSYADGSPASFDCQAYAEEDLVWDAASGFVLPGGAGTDPTGDGEGGVTQDPDPVESAAAGCTMGRPGRADLTLVLLMFGAAAWIGRGRLRA